MTTMTSPITTPALRRIRAAVLVAILMVATATAIAAVPTSQASAAPAGFTMTKYEPAKHSFRFVNSWSADLSRINLPLVGTTTSARSASACAAG